MSHQPFPPPQGLMLFGPLAEKGVTLTRYCYKNSHSAVIPDHFESHSLILLFNIKGHADVSYYSKEEPQKKYRFAIAPQRIISLVKKNSLISIQQKAGEQHQCLVLEILYSWLSSLMTKYPQSTKKEINFFLKNSSGIIKPTLSHFCVNLRLLCEELFVPDHQEDRPTLWFYAKILELISHTLLEPLDTFCCHRREHVALERIGSVKKNLLQNLVNPPSLMECARSAGCSPAYLSRTFSEYTGMTIRHYLKNLRLDHAATLLRSGRYNVTEAATAVGYSSLSHFSQSFTEIFGSPPRNFGLRQKKVQPKQVKSLLR